VLGREVVVVIVRMVIEVVRDYFQAAVSIKIGDGGGAGATRRQLARNLLLEVIAPRGQLDPVLARSIGERLITVIHHQVVAPVVEGISHPGRQKYVFVSIIVKVSRRDAPRPKGLQVRLLGDLLELGAAQVLEKRVAK